MQLLSTCLVIATVFVTALNAEFQINVPASATQCVPTEFIWTGGQEPYFLSIHLGDVPGASALQQFSGLTGTSFTWSTNVSSGTSIGLELTDADGQIAQTTPFTIQSGPNSSCLDIERPITSSSDAPTSKTSLSIMVITVTSTGLVTTQLLVTSSTRYDSTSSTSFVGTSNVSPPIPTSAPSAISGKSRFGTGIIIGTAVGIGAVAILLAPVLFLYIKRRRNRGPVACTDPFIGRSPSSDDRGDRSRPEMDEDVETQPNSSLMVRASSIDLSTQGHTGELPQSRRENISGGVPAEKRLVAEFKTRLRGRNRTAVTTLGGGNVDERPETHTAATFDDPVALSPGVERRRPGNTRHGVDGGVRLAGGRPGEAVVDDPDQDDDTVSEGSTLPPPYSSQFGET